MKLIIILTFIAFPLAAFAKTYPILEQDITESAKLYSQSEEFRQKVDEWTNKKRDEILNYGGITLPKSSDNKTYDVSYSYTLEQDIPRVDRDGNVTGVLYPKGYKFNPLLYLTYAPPPLIVFNPCDQSERDFVEDYIKSNNLYNRMLVSTGCRLKDIKGYGEFVYPLDKRMVDKFKLLSTVSIVSVDIQKGVFHVQIFKTVKSK